MKCHICDYDIPAGKKFCPGCGRVLSAAEQKRNQSSSVQSVDNTIVYRPASTGKPKTTSSDPSINNIFNTSNDSPEYKATHAYTRATVDVIEYDKTFVSRKDKEISYEDPYDDTYDFSDTSEQVFDDEKEDKGYDIEPEYENEDEYEDNDDVENTDKQPKTRINVKTLIICIALIAGIAVIVTGLYQIGKQIGLWGETETSTQSAEEEKTLGEKAPIVKEPDSTTASPTSDYKIGIYTVTSTEKNIFMQKSQTDDRVIATVPNGTVLEITEISDDMGKTTFGEYTGWLNLEELAYTPDAILSEKETTAKQPDNEVNSSVNSDENENPANDETTTEKNAPDSPGTYTVDLQGDGTYVNIRNASSTDGIVVGTVDEGVQVTVDKVENGWGYISTPDGIEGWVYMVYLR